MDKVKEVLIEKGLTIAVAESLTGGLIQSNLSKLSGSSSFYNGGITVYNIDQKVKHLNINRDEAERRNCVSKEIAGDMSKNVKSMFGSDIGVSTTGYAEPDLVNNVSVPFAFISFYFNGVTKTTRVRGTAKMTRTKMRNFITKEVIKRLPAFVKSASKAKSFKSSVDSGEVILKPHSTLITIEPLGIEALFIRKDEVYGYIFCDEFDDLRIYKSLDEEDVKYKGEKEIIV